MIRAGASCRLWRKSDDKIGSIDSPYASRAEAVQKSIQEFISSDDDDDDDEEEEDDVSPLSSLSIKSKSNKLLLPFPSAPITRPPSAKSESAEQSKTRRNSAKKRRRIGEENGGNIIVCSSSSSSSFCSFLLLLLRKILELFVIY